MVAILDEDTSVGLVQLFFDQFGEKLSKLEAFAEAAPTSDQANFERDLEAGLEHVFHKDQ